MGERLSNEGGNGPVEGGDQLRKPPPGGHNGGRNRDLAVNDEAAIFIDHNGASDKEGEASLPEVVALTKKGNNKKLKKKLVQVRHNALAKPNLDNRTSFHSQSIQDNAVFSSKADRKTSLSSQDSFHASDTSEL